MRIVDTLVKSGLVTEEDISAAREARTGCTEPITSLLVDMGCLDPQKLLQKLSESYALPVIELGSAEIDASAVNLIPGDMAREYSVFPVRVEKNELVLALSDPQNVIAIDTVRAASRYRIRPVLSTSREIRHALDVYYGFNGNGDLDASAGEMNSVLQEAKTEHALRSRSANFKELDEHFLQDSRSPIVRLVDLIFSNAVRVRASDIHIEPRENEVFVRHRIDGNLLKSMTIPSQLHVSLVARIKIMGEMDISEKRRPQDGRARIRSGLKKIDVRLSTVPTFHGEKVVMRLLHQNDSKLDTLENLDFEKDEFQHYAEAIQAKQGIILLTGPTGSGKTTTIYATLNEIKSKTKNIMTIEDPVEYLLDGVNQVQVNPKAGVFFANALRSLLRQDPDIVLVGEIRDRETADIAFRSSLTGHLVFSTLHTNDSISTVTRLYDLGLESYLVSSGLLLIVAQRLVRVSCPNCLERYVPEEEMLSKCRRILPQVRIPEVFYRGKGCDYCSNTGYRGRTAVFEILRVYNSIKRLIEERAPEQDILRAARKHGFKTLIEAGLLKALRGQTTLEEVFDVIDSMNSVYGEAESLKEIHT